MALTYERIWWVNGSGTPLNAANLNKMDVVLEEIVDELNDVLTTINSDDSESPGVVQRISRIEETLGSLPDLAALSKRVDTNQTDIEKLEENLETAIQTFSEQLEEEIKQRSENDKIFSEDINDWKSKLNNYVLKETYEYKIADIEGDLRSLYTDQESLNTDITNMKTTVISVDNDVTSIQKDIKDINSAIETLKLQSVVTWKTF